MTEENTIYEALAAHLIAFQQAFPGLETAWKCESSGVFLIRTKRDWRNS